VNRRGFLTRSGLALGALIVGDEVLETLDRLTHRKVWAGHTFVVEGYTFKTSHKLPPVMWRSVSVVEWKAKMSASHPLLMQMRWKEV